MILITSSMFVHVDIMIALNKMNEIELIGFRSVQNRFATVSQPNLSWDSIYLSSLFSKLRLRPSSNRSGIPFPLSLSHSKNTHWTAFKTIMSNFLSNCVQNTRFCHSDIFSSLKTNAYAWDVEWSAIGSSERWQRPIQFTCWTFIIQIILKIKTWFCF